ncbi:uncharacterized protein LOC127452783 isoform X2 [Myxocyprinus asiaticus]|uniref:uncharacterized protein LOC127452783 isoform X2 n=1 Tax=Myxocyprinus asiaticus TaxID=70543 RepID=UPI0022239513|nr:uncharacterized protein LOC127452783 isoform X2 [Myxocyprinus asiaticus]
MSNKCHICLLVLTILCSLLIGISGVKDTHVFCSSGENVILPCNNARSDCNTTTWNYNRNRNSETFELFAYGMKKNNTERHERLSLGSDCSLNIYKASKEDYGSYTCQQYVNGHQQGNDARVYLHVLHVSVSVSPSSTQTEIRPGRSVTLSCQLILYDGVLCDTLVSFERIQLLWVNQTGVDLQKDSRYQISSGHCISTLTTTLLNEDNNREWRCQVNNGTKVETSVSYSVKYLAPTDTTSVSSVTTPNTPTDATSVSSVTTSNTPTDTTHVSSVTTPNIATSTTIYNKLSSVSTPVSERTSTSKAPVSPSQQVIVIVVVIAALAVLLPAVLLCVILKKRAGNRREVHSNSSPGANTDDVTYSQVTVSGKKQGSKNNVHSDDKVTYASIRGATAGPHGGLQ